MKKGELDTKLNRYRVRLMLRRCGRCRVLQYCPETVYSQRSIRCVMTLPQSSCIEGHGESVIYDQVVL